MLLIVRKGIHYLSGVWKTQKHKPWKLRMSWPRRLQRLGTSAASPLCALTTPHLPLLQRPLLTPRALVTSILQSDSVLFGLVMPLQR